MKTIAQRYSPDFHQIIGAAGGRKSRGGGFASDVIGEDGLSGKERARIAGRRGRGGAASRRKRAVLDS